MKRKLILFTILLLLFPFSVAQREGSSCDYATNRDRECDPTNNLYCIDGVCTLYTGPTEEYCNDSDGDNKWVSGRVSFLYRTQTGAFVEGTADDGCLEEGSPTDYCDSTNCSIQEFVCIAEDSLPYSYVTYECRSGCRLGKCLDIIEPNSWFSVGGTVSESTWQGTIFGGASDNESGLLKVEISIKRDSDNYYWNGSNWVSDESWLVATGTTNWSYPMAFDSFEEGWYSLRSRATDVQNNTESSYGSANLNIVLTTSCNYAENGDNECDTENNFFCIGGYCTKLNEAPQVSCIDSDDQNKFSKGVVEYSYRQSDGRIASGTKSDICTNGSVKEYFCIFPLPESGTVFDSNILECKNGCLNGACKPEAFEVECVKAEDCLGKETELDCSYEWSCIENNCVAECITFPETMSDSELLAYIEQWAKGELGETEKENDLKIQQIIEIWKKS